VQASWLVIHWPRADPQAAIKAQAPACSPRALPAQPQWHRTMSGNGMLARSPITSVELSQFTPADELPSCVYNYS